LIVAQDAGRLGRILMGSSGRWEAIRHAFAAVDGQKSRDVAHEAGRGCLLSIPARTIIKEVTRLSILSTLVIVALLLGVYRSATALLLGLVPVASGGSGPVSCSRPVALGLGVVHGITLGFGVPL